jgi:hypothetical protein
MRFWSTMAALAAVLDFSSGVLAAVTTISVGGPAAAWVESNRKGNMQTSNDA